jgi:hypothetical protein
MPLMQFLYLATLGDGHLSVSKYSSNFHLSTGAFDYILHLIDRNLPDILQKDDLNAVTWSYVFHVYFVAGRFTETLRTETLPFKLNLNREQETMTSKKTIEFKFLSFLRRKEA